jgi:acylphosphatase
VADRQQLHAIVHGQVQGVNFRYSTMIEARRLGLVGWVCNRADGTVEVTAEGPRDILESLLAFLRHGPPMAHVTSVETQWSASTGVFDGFIISVDR